MPSPGFYSGCSVVLGHGRGHVSWARRAAALLRRDCQGLRVLLLEVISLPGVEARSSFVPSDHCLAKAGTVQARRMAKTHKLPEVSGGNLHLSVSATRSILASK